MGKLPAFQFYPADWRKDPGVQSLSFHDRGIWFEILCLMHESEQRGRLLLNGKAMPDEALARLLGLDKQILTKTLTTLLEYGVASRDNDGALMNRRMVRDENLRAIRQTVGKLGGNPALLKQNQTTGDNQNQTTQLNQKSTPSSASSSSSAITEQRETREAPPFQSDFTEKAQQQTAAVDEISQLLCELHGVTNESGWKIRDKLQSLAGDLAAAQATPSAIRAFWDYRRVKPQQHRFVGDFIAWRAGQQEKRNGTNRTNSSNGGSSSAAPDRWQSAKRI